MLLMLEDNDERVQRFTAALHAIDPALPLMVWRDARTMVREVGPHLAAARLISLDHDLEPLAGATDPGDGLEVVKPGIPAHHPSGYHSLQQRRTLDLDGWGIRAGRLAVLADTSAGGRLGGSRLPAAGREAAPKDWRKLTQHGNRFSREATMKLSEAANEVIALADAIRSYWDTELPRRHRDFPIVHPGEDSGPPPSEEKKLKDFLANLPDDLVYQLALLMYLGRGDFGTENLASHYEAVKEALETPDWAATEMMAKPPLGDYLVDGLAELKKNGIDVDQMLSSAANSPS